MDRHERGKQGESQAEQWLCDHGLHPVERNYRCRAGEIDLVMLDPTAHDTEVLVFVEVRLRGPGARVDSIDSIDERKQRRIITAARHFLMERPDWQSHACRFDVIGIDGASRLSWIRDAFELTG